VKKLTLISVKFSIATNTRVDRIKNPGLVETKMGLIHAHKYH